MELRRKPRRAKEIGSDPINLDSPSTSPPPERREPLAEETCKMNRPRGRPRGRGRGSRTAPVNHNMAPPIQQMQQMMQMQQMQPQQSQPPQIAAAPTPINILPLNCQEDVKPVITGTPRIQLSNTEADPINLDSPSTSPCPPPQKKPTGKTNGDDPWWDTFLDGRPNQGLNVQTATHPQGLQVPPPATAPTTTGSSPTMPMLNKEGYIQIEPTDEASLKPLPTLQKQEVTSSSVYIDVAEDPRHAMKRRLAEPTAKQAAIMDDLSDLDDDLVDENYSPNAASDLSDEYLPLRNKRPRKRRASSKVKSRKTSSQSSAASLPEKAEDAIEPAEEPSQPTPETPAPPPPEISSPEKTEKLEKIRMIQKEIEKCHELLQQEVAEYEQEQGSKLVIPGIMPIKKEPIFVDLSDDEASAEKQNESTSPREGGCQVERHLLRDLIPDPITAPPDVDAPPSLDVAGEDAHDDWLPHLTHLRSIASQTDYSPKIASLKQIAEYSTSLVPPHSQPIRLMRAPGLPPSPRMMPSLGMSQSPHMPQSPRMQSSPRMMPSLRMPQSPRMQRMMSRSPLPNMPQSPHHMSPRMTPPRFPGFSPRGSPRGTPRKNFASPRPRMSRPLFPASGEVISLLDEDDGRPSAAPRPLIQQAVRTKKPAAKTKSGLSVQGMHLIPLRANSNRSLSVEQRPFYMGLAQGQHKWISVLVKVIAGVTKYQCALCPRDFPNAPNVHDHMGQEHSNYLYLIMGKQATQASQFLYCRHCNFVTCSKPAIWYHFVLWHSITVLSQDLKARSDASSAQLLTTNGDLQKAPVAYMCISCKGVELNRTRMVSHVLRKHPNSPNIMGGFVKLKEINLTKVTIRGQPKQLAVGDDTLMDKSISSFCYVCVECSIVQYMEQEQLSHMMDMHSDKTMLYICCKCEMRFDYLFDIVNHSRTVHQAPNVQHASVSLIELNPTTREHTECNPYASAKPASSSKRPHKSPKHKKQRPHPQPFASDEVVAVDSDDELQVVSIELAPTPKGLKKGTPQKKLSSGSQALGLSYTPQKGSMRFNTDFSAQITNSNNTAFPQQPSAAQSTPPAEEDPKPGTSSSSSSNSTEAPVLTPTTQGPPSLPQSPASDASLIHRPDPEAPPPSSRPSSPHLLSLGDELPAYPEFQQPSTPTPTETSLSSIMNPHDSLTPLVSSDKDPMMPSLVTPPIRSSTDDPLPTDEPVSMATEDPLPLGDVVDESCSASLAFGRMLSSEAKDDKSPSTDGLDALLSSNQAQKKVNQAECDDLNIVQPSDNAAES